jgi:predicted RNase H-like nuclease
VRQHSSIAEDVLDALAMLWTAQRISSGRALRLPAAPETDSRGLLMEMWA